MRTAMLLWEECFLPRMGLLRNSYSFVAERALKNLALNLFEQYDDPIAVFQYITSDLPLENYIWVKDSDFLGLNLSPDFNKHNIVLFTRYGQSTVGSKVKINHREEYSQFRSPQTLRNKIFKVNNYYVDSVIEEILEFFNVPGFRATPKQKLIFQVL